MRTERLVPRLALVVAAALVLSGCPLVRPPAIAPPAAGTVTGTVVAYGAGSPVAGSTVTAVGTTVSAITDSEGRYSLSLPAGTYDLVATKSGMAASRAQSIRVPGGETIRIDLIQRESSQPALPTAPPTISVTGLANGQTVSGTVGFTVEIALVSPLEPFVSYVGYGFVPGAFGRSDFINFDDRSFTVSWNSLTRANGPLTVWIVTYDTNHNRSMLPIDVTVANPVVGTAPATPTGLWPVAITLSRSIRFFRADHAERAKVTGEDPGKLTVTVRGVQRQFDLQGVPDDANIWVDIVWNRVTGARGYKIFRASSEDGPWELIAQRTDPPVGATALHRDFGPGLEIGRRVWYRVSAFNEAGESAPTAAEWVEPLRPFYLALAAPANNASGVDTTPTFVWATREMVGRFVQFRMYVKGYNAPWPVVWLSDPFVVPMAPSWSRPYNFDGRATAPLQSLTMYEWDLLWARAFDDLHPVGLLFRAVSWSGGSLFGGQPATEQGTFRFTTR